MITLYSLSNDHAVSSYNGTLSIQGCQVNHVSEAFQTKKQGNLGNRPKCSKQVEYENIGTISVSMRDIMVYLAMFTV